jgi:hypothetical protein
LVGGVCNEPVLGDPILMQVDWHPSVRLSRDYTIVPSPRQKRRPAPRRLLAAIPEAVRQTSRPLRRTRNGSESGRFRRRIRSIIVYPAGSVIRCIEPALPPNRARFRLVLCVILRSVRLRRNGQPVQDSGAPSASNVVQIADGFPVYLSDEPQLYVDPLLDHGPRELGLTISRRYLAGFSISPNRVQAIETSQQSFAQYRTRQVMSGKLGGKLRGRRGNASASASVRRTGRCRTLSPGSRLAC